MGLAFIMCFVSALGCLIYHVIFVQESEEIFCKNIVEMGYIDDADQIIDDIHFHLIYFKK